MQATPLATAPHRYSGPLSVALAGSSHSHHPTSPIYHPVEVASIETKVYIIYHKFLSPFNSRLHSVNLIRTRPLVQVDVLQIRLDVLHWRAAAA